MEIEIEEFGWVKSYINIILLECVNLIENLSCCTCYIVVVCSRSY